MPPFYLGINMYTYSNTYKLPILLIVLLSGFTITHMKLVHGDLIEQLLPSFFIVLFFIFSLKHQIKISSLSISIFLLAASLILVSIYNNTTITNLNTILLYFATAIIASIIFHNEKTTTFELAKALILIGSIQVFFAIIIYYNIGYSILDHIFQFGSTRMIGLIGQSNLLANILLCALASIIFLYKNNNKLLFLLIAFSIGIAGSGSRMGLVGLLFISILNFKKNKKIIFLAWLSVISFYSISYLLNDTGLTSTENMIRESSLTLRLYESFKGILLFFEHPISGVGSGEYLYQSLKLTDPNISYLHYNGFFNHTHNIATQLLAEFGIIGLLSIIIFFYFILYSLYKSKNLNIDEKKFILSIISVQAIHSLLEYPLWYFNFMILLVSTLSLIFNEKNRLTLNKKINKIIIIPVILISFFIFSKTLIILQVISYSHNNPSKETDTLLSLLNNRSSKILTNQSNLLLAYKLGPKLLSLPDADYLTYNNVHYIPNEITIPLRLEYLKNLKAQNKTEYLELIKIFEKNYPISYKEWENTR